MHGTIEDEYHNILTSTSLLDSQKDSCLLRTLTLSYVIDFGFPYRDTMSFRESSGATTMRKERDKLDSLQDG